MIGFSQDRLVFISSPSKLQEMAATKLALALWSRKIDTDYSNDTPCFQWFPSQVISAAEYIDAPRIIATIIDTQIELLRRDLKEWMYYNLARIFFDRDHRDAILRCIHEVRFKSNCTIDHNETIKCLTKCPKLTYAEKKRIPYVWHEDDFVSRTIGSCNPFGDTILQMNNWYVDNVMCGENTLKSVDSYFETLSAEDQAKYLKRSLRENPSNLVFLLPRINVEALNKILDERGAKVVYSLAQSAENAQYAYQVWLYLEKGITKTQFQDVILNLLDYRLHMNDGRYEDDYIDTLISNIWTRAPVNMRKLLLSDDNYDRVVARLCRPNEYFVKDLRRSLDFLLEFLSHKDSTYKYQLWMRCWRDLIVGSKPAHLDELMHTCLKNSKTVARYKQTFLLDFHSDKMAKPYYDILMKKRYHRELNVFLNFCTGGDRQQMANLRRQLLLSVHNEIYLLLNCPNIDSLREFDQFITHFLQDPETADQIKNQIVMLPENLAALNKKIENYDLLAVKDLLNCFLTSKADLDNLKSTFLCLCRTNLLEGKLYNFEILKWRKFLEWCFGDSQGDAIKDFEESMPIDVIFSKALRRCVQWQRYLLLYGCKGANRDNSMRGTLGKCDFYELSEFLSWYFKSPEAAFVFKMDKVREYKGFGRIRSKFEAESEDAYMILEEWFFEGWPEPYLPLCRF